MSCQSCEKPTLHVLDVITGAVVQMFSDLQQAGKSTMLKSKSFDLKSAYKQLPISEKALKHSFISLYHPATKGPIVYQSLAVPFGSVQAAHFFLRCARALWHLGVSGLRIVWSSFYDDYILMERSSLVRNTDECARMLFDLLGWVYDKDGDKSTVFADSVDALGVTLDFSNSIAAEALVKNTIGRVEEISEAIDEILNTRTLSAVEALRLRGRLAFAEGQIFGRSARKTLKMVTEHAYSGKRGGKITPQLEAALLTYKKFLACGASRRVRTCSKGTWVLLTDASFDSTEGAFNSCLGAVLANPTGQICEYFSFELERRRMVSLGLGVKDTSIHEAEMLAAFLGLTIWSETLAGCQAILCIDNDPVRFNLISGIAESDASNNILDAFTLLEESLNVMLWITRVASPSNWADLPSRREMGPLDELGAKRVFVRNEHFPGFLSRTDL